MRKILLLSAALTIVGAGLACDFEKTANQLQSQKVIVATILATPPVELSPLDVAGFDGGFPPDAGFELDAGTVTVPSQTAAFVFFGERSAQSLDAEPKPLTGATVSVRAEGSQGVALEEKGEGTYALTSSEDERLVYGSGQNLLFEVKHGGVTYVGLVEDAPELERVEAFHPPSGYIEQSANTAFTFTRPPAQGNEERNLGFVTVFPVDQNGERGEPTWTNMPSKPLDFLKLVALPAKWKEDKVTVPGSAFPQADQTYLIVLQAVKLGGPESDNLFTGSALLAGTAEIGVVRTK